MPLPVTEREAYLLLGTDKGVWLLRWLSPSTQSSHEQDNSNGGVANEKADNNNSGKNGVKQPNKEAW